MGRNFCPRRPVSLGIFPQTGPVGTGSKFRRISAFTRFTHQMSAFLPRRALFLILVLFLVASAASAVTPTSRYDARMVYDASTTHTILFDGGTKLPYELSDTWDWNGQVWTQLFPQHVPPARYGYVMVYDSARQRIVMFGGRTANNTKDLNDTWVFKNGDWTQIDTPNSPGGRVLAGGAYDPLRDRVVVFGGATISADEKTTTPYHDTWEFDGTTWTKVLSDGPTVDKPLMTWDAARHVVFLLAVDSKIATHQYTYDPAAPAWNEKTGIGLPTCVNEGAIVFQERNNTVYFTGGSCSGVTSIEDNLEWDGEKWNVVTVKVNVGRLFGPAMTYDASRQQVVLFGGSPATGGAPRNELWVYNGDWTPIFDTGLTPSARSLFVFRPDPVGGGIWLFGGLDPAGDTNSDFWKFQYGKWQPVVTATDAPEACSSPASAFDTNRNKLVIVCADSTTAEFDLTDWKILAPKHAPQSRAFRSMAYDENLKKSVIFGGYLDDYVNETWLWDGTDWTEVSRNLPPWRIRAAMWFDSHLNRTVIFGGVGRAERQGRLTRFNDMWSFDGNGWTEIKPAHVPSPRYGGLLAIEPGSGNVLMFGGLRTDTVEVPGTGNNPPTTKEVQVYTDDFWEWDGTDWKQVTYPRVPYARESGGMAWDSSTGMFVIYGGYAGQQHLSDLWILTPDKGWQPFVTNVVRRRSTGR